MIVVVKNGVDNILIPDNNERINFPFASVKIAKLKKNFLSFVNDPRKKRKKRSK